MSSVESLFDLTGRVAIVTGGTRGIGRALAEGFVDAGASVVVASRKPEACEETEAHLRAMGGDALGVPAHMGDVEALQGLVDRTIERFGRLDIVVNNAATLLSQPLGQITTDAWSKVFDVDLRGPVFLVQSALPHLAASPCPSVVNILAIAAFTFEPGVAMYAAAKSGLLSFTRSMAAACAPQGVRVNALAPGAVATDMVRSTPAEAQSAMVEACLLKRIADPEEMVGPALFLASDAASYVTGQVLVADGGTVAY